MTDQTESGLVVPDKMTAPLADVEISMRTIQSLIQTPSVPERWRESETGVQDMFAAYLIGKELGIGPMESWNSLFLVNGTVSLLGRLMTAQIWRNHHRITVDVSDQYVIARAFRRDHFTKKLDEVGQWKFGKADAKKAYLDSQATYENYPKLMWSWRAISAVTRIYFADCISGTAGYTPEEAGVVGAPVEPMPDYIDLEVDGEVISKVDIEQASATVEDVLDADVVVDRKVHPDAQ